MKKFLLAISGVLLALGALIAPANAQQASSAFILSACGTLPAGVTYAAGQFGILTMDTTGKLCDSATGGGGGSGAVFGPTAAGSAAANPPVIIGGTADGTATGNVVNWKVLAGIGYINCANCSGSGVSSVDEVAFVAGTSLFAGTGGFFQTTATLNPLTNGQQGMFQVTANRALFSNLRNAAGAEIGVAAAPVQVSLANTAANATPILVNQPTGTNLHSVVDSGTITTVTSLSQQTGWAGGTLGAMANYGTSPGAVLVPGVNAFITNATPGIANNADAIAAVAASSSSPVPVNNYGYLWNGSTWDRQPGSTTGAQVKIASGGIASGALASGSVASGAIASGAVASGAVASGAYVSGSLASGAVVDLTNMSVTTGSAPPSKALYVGANASGATGGQVVGLITCDKHVFKHITSATDTLAVQGVASQTIRICGWRSRAAGVATWFLENTASVNANCSSSNTQITGVATEAANTGETMLAAYWTGLANTSGNGLCINSTGTGGVDVDIWYNQF